MINDSIAIQAEDLFAACRAKGNVLATAESCTGGLIAATLTAVACSSDVVDSGFVAHSNASKTELVGVPLSLIESHGAVSDEVARAMAAGALARSHTTAALPVTGIVGPAGGSAEKPVRLVCFGLAWTGRPVTSDGRIFAGDRGMIWALTVEHAFSMTGAPL